MTGDLTSGFGWTLNICYHIVLYSVWDSMRMWVFGGASKDIRPELLQCPRKVPLHVYRWSYPSPQGTNGGVHTIRRHHFFCRSWKCKCSV